MGLERNGSTITITESQSTMCYAYAYIEHLGVVGDVPPTKTKGRFSTPTIIFISNGIRKK